MVGTIPDEGDLVWLNFTPHAGSEQAGKRPVLVLSPASYNEKIGLMVVCPVTSRVKGYVFEVPLPSTISIQGVVLADHVKSVDWRSRGATIVDQVPTDTLAAVKAKIKALLRIS